MEVIVVDAEVDVVRRAGVGAVVAAVGGEAAPGAVPMWSSNRIVTPASSSPKARTTCS